MTTARELLDLLALYQRFQQTHGGTKDLDEMFRALTDDQLKLLVQVVASGFRTLKAEAERRGVWEELKTMKITKP
jgi:hypothetical protein